MFTVWDRKTPRHKWRHVVTTDNRWHFQNVLIHQYRTVLRWTRWTRGQVGYTLDNPARDNTGVLPLDANAAVKVVLSKGEGGIT